MNKPRETKPHIGVFGRCNVGKSTLINKLVGQEISIVSSQAGTTTDTVKKSMEIKGIGAVVLIDT
ncbi:MAG: 50S ribosome-binding GTPase, partial [Bacteroidales bacterium]|nr:50S ribosome-binding GTPase [Bacteroidales bacterium]